jgi:hypothetical protein
VQLCREQLCSRKGGHQLYGMASPSQTGDATKTMYHEKQHLGHCAVHTLNNLFQSRWASYALLSDIASSLYSQDRATGLSSVFSLNPYQSAIPFVGYFDIACIAEALKLQRCRISEHVARESDLDSLNLETDNVVGLIVNQSTSSMIGFVRGTHWFAVLKQCSSTARYVILDSNNDEAVDFTEEELKAFLKSNFAKNNCQIFVVSRDF